MKRLTLCLLSFLLVPAAYSKDNSSEEETLVKGTVYNQQDRTVPNASVALHDHDRPRHIAFNVRDLLDSQNFEATINNPNYYFERRFSWSSRSFSLNCTYHINRQEGSRDNRRRGGDWEMDFNDREPVLTEIPEPGHCKLQAWKNPGASEAIL